MVPPASHRVSRVLRYSGSSLLLSVFGYGALTLCRRPSHAVLLTYRRITLSTTPKILLPSVWPNPRSLATTSGISVDVFSSPYLDVSVQAVPRVRLFDSTHAAGVLEVCSSGFPHSEISGSMLICSSPKLIAACHVLHRLLMPRHSPCALSSLTLRFAKRNVIGSLAEFSVSNYADS